MEPKVSLEGTTIVIGHLESTDAALAELLGSQPANRWPELVERALSVGAVV